MKEILSFLKELSANNNREWFETHRPTYLEIKKKVEDMTQTLIDGIAKFEPTASALRPADCLYRIYRDTRFSPDKTPYKNHIGIYINPFGGKKSELAGYYLHIQPGNMLVGGGLWCPTPEILREVRSAIYGDTEEYLEIIEAPEFKALFDHVGEDEIKTAPKGFPKDWEHVALLRPRSYTIGHNYTDAQACKTDFLTRTLDAFRVMKPFTDFLNDTIRLSRDPE